MDFRGFKKKGKKIVSIEKEVLKSSKEIISSPVGSVRNRGNRVYMNAL